MFNISFSKNIVHVLVAVITLCAPSISHAGFEWTPPPVAPKPAEQPNLSSDDVLTSAPTGPLTPEPEQSLPVPVGHVEKSPEPVVMPVASEPLVASPTSPPIERTIEGFGKDIPLAIALRDIVPSSYAFVFTPREISGTKISWRGGKAWPDVLLDALSPYGLDASVGENTIQIFPRAYTNNSTEMRTMDAPMPLIEDSSVSAAPPQDSSVASPTIPVVEMAKAKKWEARPGSTLRQTIESWSKSARVELTWSTPYDYPIQNAFYFKGSFDEAIDSLLATYGGESPAPKGRLYPNLPDGPSVLMIN